MHKARTSEAKALRMLHRRLDRVEVWLPDTFSAWVRHLRHPSMSWVRVPLGILLVCGGVLSFLPFLGVWMLPLGLILLALDVALLRRPTAQAVVSGERWWRRRFRRRPK